MSNLAYATKQVDDALDLLKDLAGRETSAEAARTALSRLSAVLTESEEGAHRIRDVAADLNMLARNDQELRLVDVRLVADAALRMAAHETARRARIIRQYDEVPYVRANASKLGQVLLNLLVNAAHAIEPGARDANEIAVRVRSERGRVVVEVRDTGCGIGPEHRERLFTPFFTTKPVGQGTGLGLSISKRIILSLGGDIEVDSAPGRGTTVRVLLPDDLAARSGRPPADPPPG
jgi:signal transduction histidine kinase